MAGVLIVLRGVLARRVVAATNVTAFGAAAQVQPPAA